MRIDMIGGIGPVYRRKLEAVGIPTTDALLERCGASAGRKAVAAETGIRETMLMKWTNKADLMRLNAVSGEFYPLLEAAGVRSVRELKHRNAEALHERLANLNEARKLARRTPERFDVWNWVNVAQRLEPKVSQ
jgi:predicted RecB family nuclease